jgi:hypothetical protein
MYLDNSACLKSGTAQSQRSRCSVFPPGRQNHARPLTCELSIRASSCEHLLVCQKAAGNTQVSGGQPMVKPEYLPELVFELSPLNMVL